jgi:hypothetical protein
MTADGVTRQVTGSGYHDHNWGNVSPANLFDNWWWGRGRIGDHTIIASDIRGNAAVGGTRIPLFFVGDDHQVHVNAYGSNVSAVEAAPYAIPIQSMSAPSAQGSPTSPLMEVGPNSRFPIAS